MLEILVFAVNLEVIVELLFESIELRLGFPVQLKNTVEYGLVVLLKLPLLFRLLLILLLLE